MFAFYVILDARIGLVPHYRGTCRYAVATPLVVESRMVNLGELLCWDVNKKSVRCAVDYLLGPLR